MRRLILGLGLLLVVAAAVPAGAMAEPKTGFGLYVGAGDHSGSISSTSFSPTINYHTKSTSPMAGLDIQLRMGASTSLGVFIESLPAAEYTCTGCGTGNTVSDSLLGGEFRFWFDSVFLGGRFGYVNETFTPKGGGKSTSGDGAAAGVTLGWEGQSGLFFKFVYDVSTLDISQSGQSSRTDDMSVTRLFLGYRF